MLFYVKRLMPVTKKSRSLIMGTFASIAIGVAILAPAISHASNVTFSSTRDCDSNAVMNCGAMNTNELINKYAADNSIKNIYTNFGISSVDIKTIGDTSVAGKVMKNGDVYVGSKLVATNVITAGREPMTGSTKVVANGTTFYKRPPSVSFASDSLDAYIVMQNDQFSFAILAACGNPVTGTPIVPKKPGYNLNKEVRVGNGAWQPVAVNMNFGDTAEFRVTVSSTGQAPATKITVKDAMPSNLDYIGNTLKQDGKDVSSADTNAFFAKGMVIDTLAPGDQIVFTYRATTPEKTQPTPCTDEHLINVAHIDNATLPVIENTAQVNVKCQPVNTPKTPSYTLTKEVQVKGDNVWHKSLTGLAPGTHVLYRLTISSTGTAPVTDVIVKDALPAHVTYVDDSLRQDGKVIPVSNFFGAGIIINSIAPGAQSITGIEAIVGADVATSSSSCTTDTLTNTGTILASSLPIVTDAATVSEKCTTPQVPTYSCDLLDTTMLSRTAYSFTVHASANGGAAISRYTLAIVDKDNKNIYNQNQNGSDFSFTFAPGTYTITGSVTVKLPDGTTKTVSGDRCAHHITVKPAPAAECKTLTAVIGDKKSDDSRDVSFSVETTVSDGTNVKNYAYYFTAAATQADLLTDKNTATHNYAPGTYQAHVIVSFNGVEDGAASSSCTAPLTIPGTPTPPSLPNTGAGDVVGIFAVTSFAGVMAYRTYLSRRFGR